MELGVYILFMWICACITPLFAAGNIYQVKLQVCQDGKYLFNIKNNSLHYVELQQMNLGYLMLRQFLTCKCNF